MKQRKVKQWISGILACLILGMTIITSRLPLTSYAASFTGKNIWSGSSEIIFGKNRSYLYRWSDGYQNTFCIEPGQHMSSKVIAGAGRYNIDDSNIPYIDNTEDFRRMALICDWYEKKAGAISATNASYAAGQVAVWAVISGQWDNVSVMAAKVNTHVAGTSAKMVDLLEYVDTAYSGADGLPEWVSASQLSAAENPQNMILEDGSYKLNLDISSCPDLGQVSWELPSGFSQAVSGTTLTFTYNSTEPPSGIIKGQAPVTLASVIKNSENLTIYVPENEQRDQAMISAGLTSLNELYINIGGTKQSTPAGESPVVEIFRHKETFESNYRIDLQKYCAETGLDLEGSTFDVLEAFDSSQLGSGRHGTVSESNMSPRPATWTGFRICAPVRTDEQGHAQHADRKWYHYNKTYCGGHPEPEYVECDHDSGEREAEGGEGGEREDCGCEEENERLRAEWEALIGLCEEETDFHDIEEDVARERMVEDRDETYDTFINLVYQYTVKETGARPGYIVHGNHNDDRVIETVATDASEAGANAVVVSVTKDVHAGDTDGRTRSVNNGRKLPGLDDPEEPGVIRSVIPPSNETAITERREIIRAGVPATASNATPSDGVSARSGSTFATASNATESNVPLSEQELLKNYYEAADDSEEVEIYDNIRFSDVRTWLNLRKYAASDSGDGHTGYQYRLYPVKRGERQMPVVATGSDAASDGETARRSLLSNLLKRFFGTKKEDDDDMPVSVSVSLPEPEPDHVADVVCGAPGNLSYTFRVENHRTEGEIHINKRDLELFQDDEQNSYGESQGDATLQGAVYGLFAGADLIHPDGKSGIVYKAGELVSIGTTDINGDASFLAITEESETSVMAANHNGTWIGRPLLLGSYYIKELSRSEGYELSVSGITLSESNRSGGLEGIYLRAGEVSATELAHRIDNQDGSWNETTVSYYKTEQGFDVIISGYPEGSKIFEVKVTETNETGSAVIDSQLVPKTDEAGNPVYQLAAGGELKLDSSGNPVMLGGIDTGKPFSETWYLNYRTGGYPSGTAEPILDPAKWADTSTVDMLYIKDEVNHMLAQLGYRMLDQTDGGGAPWVNLHLTAATNEEIGTEILDWYAANNFWDSAAVESVIFNGSHYEARIFYDYQGQSGSAVYDSLNRVMYIRKRVTVSGGASASYAWIAYPAGSFSISGFYAAVSPKMEYDDIIPFGADQDAYLAAKYEPLYDRYAQGEVLRGPDGNPIPVMEWTCMYGEVTEVIQNETLLPVDAVYDPGTGTYTIHVDNRTDWALVNEKQFITYRVQAPETSITSDGVTMDYSDYLVQVAGAGVTVLAAGAEIPDSSYVKYQALVYPGQVQVYQDGGTRTAPVQVLQRIIRQPVKVTKDISRKSYEENNTYRIHRDPFTVLFGGYAGSGKKYIADFHFKIYLVSELERAGLLARKEDGSYDYKVLFDDETKRDDFDRYAVAWDRPERDLDHDLTTLHASEGNGNEPYYGRSVMLPYGTYVIVEQVPRNLVNKHYQLDDPKEVTLPFVPQIDADGTVHDDIPSAEYLYVSSYSPEELQEKFLIRFNEETHVIRAHSHDGDFEIYKYGLDPDVLPASYGNEAIGARYHYGVSENAGSTDNVFYRWLYDRTGTIVDYGVTRDNVDTMTGISTAVDGKYAAALVPWSVLEPRYGEVINDSGDIGNRVPGLEKGLFNFVGFASEHFENSFYTSKLRVEKIDGQTGENIIHDGALFKIYAASREVSGAGAGQVAGSGRVLFETVTVTGTRAELEARGDVDDITWDSLNQTYRGTVVQPVYDETEQIWMLNELGEEVGIFKAFSTEHPVIRADGSVVREKTGYIETYRPLGAGTYVLVEVQAPAGYQRSRPIAFEIYKDEVAYYSGGDPDSRTISDRYQYVRPETAPGEPGYQDAARVIVTDSPSKLYIHKVEDGDERIGDQNGLDHLAEVNDRGDLLTYIVRGRREYLEARGDIDNITWNADRKEYYGTVTKTYDEWSEMLVGGTETEMQAAENIKPLYEVGTGYFSGYGIRYDVYIKEAVMSLYEGLQLERTGQNTYDGVTVTRDGGAVVSVRAAKTGSRLEITTRERDQIPPYYPIWDTEAIDNKPVELYFYDLSEVSAERDEETGELWVLDQAGNRVCYADSLSGMAYTYDDYGNLIAYRAVDGEKVLARSIEVHHDGAKEHIYVNLITEDDEIGLPLYYHSGGLTYRTEQWKTDGTAHEIERLPFGAYILEETVVPYDQGYIKIPDIGLILRESSVGQHFYVSNIFTKLNLAKVDITTGEEIRDAQMTLYKAVREEDDSDRGYRLVKGQVYASWISGYEYDDNGNLKTDENGNRIPTAKPHWIDHIPVGDYILEETVVPYDQGYVQSQSLEVVVSETGNVQTGVMEDDYTGLEIKKYDTGSGDVLSGSRPALLALYQADLDEDGRPLIKSAGDVSGREIPVYTRDNLLVRWQTADGTDIAATAREVTDEYGQTKTIYDYNRIPLTTTKKGYFYITEKGTTMFHYLPVGYYVLVEEGTPEGYATADPVLIEITDKGHLEKIHYYEMPDVPLTVRVAKTRKDRGKEVAGAFLQIFRTDEFGIREEPAVYEWYSGTDGVYTDGDLQAGLIPEGREPGDLKSHQIEYIPLGDYVLVETVTPYGFLKSADVYFTVYDTPALQDIEMTDEIPEGRLKIIKRDSTEEDWLLENAVFEFWNQTTGELIETLITDGNGEAVGRTAVPIGFLNEKGSFSAYTYEVMEINAPDTHMLNRIPFEFQFQYQDEHISVIQVTYDAVNDINQVKVSKKELTSREELPGAEMMVTGKYTKNIVDHWISTEQPHYINGILPGTYILTELTTPGPGYVLAESIEFEVTENMELIPYLEMFDDHTKTVIEKVAGSFAGLLAGARLQLETKDGEVLYQWITTATEGYRINGLEPGEYVLRETEAPAGYRIGDPATIIIEETTALQTFSYRNYKVGSKGGGNKPGTKEPEKTVGKMIPEYAGRLQKAAGNERLPYHPFRLPGTGDGSRITLWIALCLISGSGIIASMTLKRKKQGKNSRFKQIGLFTVIGLLLFLLYSDTVYADEIPTTIEEIRILQAKDKDMVPAYAISRNEADYLLSEWRMECREIPERREIVAKTIVYDGLEYLDEIISELPVEITDEVTGQTQTALCRLTGTEIINEYWDDGFTVPVTCFSYPSDLYYLGEVPVTEDQLMADAGSCRDAILEYLNLPRSEYQIEQILWDGEAYEDENGEPCRRAIAYGKRLLRKYQAEYEGEALFPAAESYRLTAAYTLKTEVTGDVLPVAATKSEAATVLPRSADIIAEDATETVLLPKAELIVQSTGRPVLLIRIGAGAFIFFLAVLLWFAIRNNKKAKS